MGAGWGKPEFSHYNPTRLQVRARKKKEEGRQRGKNSAKVILLANTIASELPQQEAGPHLAQNES